MNPAGRFGLANRLEPKLRPTQRFKETPREIFGRLIQCRTGHAHVGEYYDFSTFQRQLTANVASDYKHVNISYERAQDTAIIDKSYGKDHRA